VTIVLLNILWIRNAVKKTVTKPKINKEILKTNKLYPNSLKNVEI